jgi:hypothetical protein
MVLSHPPIKKMIIPYQCLLSKILGFVQLLGGTTPFKTKKLSKNLLAIFKICYFNCIELNNYGFRYLTFYEV